MSDKLTKTAIDQTVIETIEDFLGCATPDAWCEFAANNVQTLLVDHAHCEKKAASSAMHLIYHYPQNYDLVHKMSRLAREELRHMEQVLKIMRARGIVFKPIAPSRYAGEFRKLVRTFEPARLVDLLIIGAFIEARSCERFYRLLPLLDDELKAFYASLLRSEGRHFQDYLKLADTVAKNSGDDRLSPTAMQDRIAQFAKVEQQLIATPDEQFRFHSGIPACATHAAHA